ncbi:MAG: formamidopyrimidine-DNA glycosylase [Chloroflexi bacterium HGW-Chloroflexi-5]|nr:MAG: formamidopyrimidine-DNA glycosylase [Chloroflexi bacterium HGW-Chloroflexi-5]
MTLFQKSKNKRVISLKSFRFNDRIFVPNKDGNMPELPEITSRAIEMNKELTGKTIQAFEVLQPKCLNVTPDELNQFLNHSVIESVTHHGKWIMAHTTQGWLLINLGMGGEILLVNRKQMPAKYKLVIDFTDQSCLAINFWWFGYVHFCALDGLTNHPMIAKLGPNVLDLSEEDFTNLIKNQKGKLKAFLLDQSRLAGIGNAYVHDILFIAKLHPNRLIANLSTAEISALFKGIQDGLRPSLAKGGAFYEMNLYGEKGGFQMEDIIIGYRENTPCPQCGAPIQKIKTGSTSSFICSTCQPES